MENEKIPFPACYRLSRPQQELQVLSAESCCWQTFCAGSRGAGCGAVICGKRNVCNAPGVQLQEDARTMEEPNARESILWDGVHRRLNIVGIINIVGLKSAVRDNNK